MDKKACNVCGKLCLNRGNKVYYCSRSCRLKDREIHKCVEPQTVEDEWKKYFGVPPQKQNSPDKLWEGGSIIRDFE